eukprot:TRINITY_DN1821_c0_g1_i1.p1 TRINITY_DN1821_c0_g1~~TRINITY_DN1821_c0_g1_i1.p1  ORF type:complete len:416 (+),score=112.89 TRINITY_DN1821_c0_g1_i1:46-1293(+)
MKDKKKKKQTEGRAFDMSKYDRRHIALKFSYIGTAYQGLAAQDHTDETVEAKLFASLKRVRLIGEDEKMPDMYSRCGRTDKGVSALGQVAACNLRVNKDGDMDYVGILNRVLPEDIRVTGWSHVSDDFSARFTCSGRVYKYFFLKGAKDISRMQEAAALLVGEHDFRNFAKLDVVNVSNFVREIFSFTVSKAAPGLSEEVYVLTITGTAFLYHQVRCMTAILFAIGEGLEDVDLVSKLLDVEGACPAKPCYMMAPDSGLVLWDCLFPSVKWTSTADAYNRVVAHFAQHYTAAMIRPMIDGHIHKHLVQEQQHMNLVSTGGKEKPSEESKHVKILSRPVEKSYKQKLADLSGSKKFRLEANIQKCSKKRSFIESMLQEGDAEVEPTAGEDEEEPPSKRREYMPRTALSESDWLKYH